MLSPDNLCPITGKRQFFSKEDAYASPAFRMSKRELWVYVCQQCKYWHLTHKRQKLGRGLDSRIAALAEELHNANHVERK